MRGRPRARKHLTLGVALAAALAVPGGAAAKGGAAALEVCGASGCTRITDRAFLVRFEHAISDVGRSIGPIAPAPYYELRVVTPGGGNAAWRTFYIPTARVVRGVRGGYADWRRAIPRERALLDRLTTRLKPFSVPVITRATVGRRVASDPGSYLALYRLPTTQERIGSRDDWRRIRLHSARPSPWTDGTNLLSFSPSGRAVIRDGDSVRLPGGVAASLMRGGAVRISSGRRAVAELAVPVAMLGFLALAAYGLRRRSASG